MPTSVYSAQFINYSAATPNTEFLVPAGFTAVVRQISYAVLTSDVFMAVNIQNDADAPAVAIDLRTLYTVAESVHVEGRWVVPEEGIISVYLQSLGGTPQVYVGGYLLRNSYAGP